VSGLVVRTIDIADAADIAAIYAHESVIANTGQVPMKSGQFWMGFWKSKDPEAIELVCEVNGRAVGHLGILTNASPRRKHVATFGIAVHPDSQGRGVGNALVGEMLRLADNWLNLVRVELTVASDNVRAMSLYRKHGFVVEGEALYDNFRAGDFTHSTSMARINPTFEKLAT
jgi:L-phenylalanine/L-methionine N-acetyltransferase